TPPFIFHIAGGFTWEAAGAASQAVAAEAVEEPEPAGEPEHSLPEAAGAAVVGSPHSPPGAVPSRRPTGSGCPSHTCTAGRRSRTAAAPTFPRTGRRSHHPPFPARARRRPR